MSLVSVEDLKKSFGKVEALKGVDMEVKEGEILGVLGPNGAGKSTLIDIVTGQNKPDSGNLRVLGIDTVENPVEVREKMGVLPEREDPPSFLTGNEYLDFVSDVREKDIDKEKWIDRMGLAGKMDKQTRLLSKGERQKLLIIQAFFHDPELVFIDEPLVNLDPFIQEEAKDVFREYIEEGGTIFLCTHVVSLAEEMCDRVLFLENGQIENEIMNVENLKEDLFSDR